MCHPRSYPEAFGEVSEKEATREDERDIWKVRKVVTHCPNFIMAPLPPHSVCKGSSCSPKLLFFLPL